ncbi:hypothetical protein A5886_000933 [Enterococcus sp. 8G7_MSG3316]|uniref:Glycosyl transferase family 1 domain-containing protein n=1 Tax=Candidatus Enterococcus testudinis TaxID=1834191 RepID=A0A242A487_9ENTE|nr:hypothetical protein A5886_000933 [Enterococcus sp. 8G7_MSG3316]
MIEKNSLSNCYLFEYLRENEFNNALSITDYFIVSLESDLSGLAVPSKTYSYYQAGKPVIAIMNRESDIYKEISDNYAGLSVENGESEKIVEHLLEVLNEPKKLETMSYNMKEKIKPIYTRSNQIEKYRKMLSNLLED